MPISQFDSDCREWWIYPWKWQLTLGTGLASVTKNSTVIAVLVIFELQPFQTTSSKSPSSSPSIPCASKVYGLTQLGKIGTTHLETCETHAYPQSKVICDHQSLTPAILMCWIARYLFRHIYYTYTYTIYYCKVWTFSNAIMERNPYLVNIVILYCFMQVGRHLACWSLSCNKKCHCNKLNELQG